MDYQKLKKKWQREEDYSFQGWDFSHLNNRWEEEQLPWNYKHMVKEYLKKDDHLLDMGTGGGEFLLSLYHPYERTAVTEAWEPNVKLCNEKLSPLGICVRQVNKDTELPFEDNSFDIIINRHEAYDVKEVKRILKPNGMFITQQVGGKNNEILSKRLIDDFQSDYPNLNLKNALKDLEKNAFNSLYTNEYFPYLRFFDVGAIVYYAKVIQWEFPGFSVDGSFDELFKMEQELNNRSYIESYEHRFIVVAKNIGIYNDKNGLEL